MVIRYMDPQIHLLANQQEARREPGESLISEANDHDLRLRKEGKHSGPFYPFADGYMRKKIPEDKEKDEDYLRAYQLGIEASEGRI